MTSIVSKHELKFVGSVITCIWFVVCFPSQVHRLINIEVHTVSEQILINLIDANVQIKIMRQIFSSEEQYKEVISDTKY